MGVFYFLLDSPEGGRDGPGPALQSALWCHAYLPRAGELARAAHLVEQPAPQLSLLGPGEAAHLMGVVGRPLDEGQSLEHRVMKVCCHLGSFLSPSAFAPLGDELPAEAQPPWGEHEGEPSDDPEGRPRGGDVSSVEAFGCQQV